MTTRPPEIRLDGRMSATLKRHFERHAELLTFVRDFLAENYPTAGRNAAQARPTIVRRVSEVRPIPVRDL